MEINEELKDILTKIELDYVWDNSIFCSTKRNYICLLMSRELDDEELQVVLLRSCFSNKECAKKFNVSPPYITRIYKRAVSKLIAVTNHYSYEAYVDENDIKLV